MKRRTSVLFEQDQFDRLERSARRHGRTVSGEIRELVAQGLPDVNPNQGLLDLMEEFARIDRPGVSDPSVPNAGDPDFKRWLRDSMARKLEAEISDWRQTQ